MTFTSRYDSDSTGKFMVGDIARVVYLSEEDYHAVSQLLNEARRMGRQDAVRELSAHVAQVAREMEWR